MKRVLLSSIFCLSLTACGTMDNMSLSSLNPFSNDETTTQTNAQKPSAVITPNETAIATELDEMERLTGVRMDRPSPALVESQPAATEIEIAMAEPDQENIEKIKEEEEEEELIAPIQKQVMPAPEQPVSEIKMNAESAPAKEEIPAEIIVENKTPVTEPMAEPIAIETKKVETPKPVSDSNTKLSSATGCPRIEIMPATRSITKFEENMSGEMIARASISEIRGGCEVVGKGMEVDLDILMRGTIGNKGRFEGKVNEEAFVTFPYFVSIFTPQGLPVNKEIMATAMRFRPSIDYIDHAEKITQFIPMDNVSLAQNYKIIVGYQLTRKQLEYNRIAVTKRPNDNRASPDTSKATRKSYNPLAN